MERTGLNKKPRCRGVSECFADARTAEPSSLSIFCPDTEATAQAHTGWLRRMSTSPKKTGVHMMRTSGFATPLGGVGEPGMPVIALALGNAFQAAVGKRIPALPLRHPLMAWRQQASRPRSPVRG